MVSVELLKRNSLLLSIFLTILESNNFETSTKEFNKPENLRKAISK